MMHQAPPLEAGLACRTCTRGDEMFYLKTQDTQRAWGPVHNDWFMVKPSYRPPQSSLL